MPEKPAGMSWESFADALVRQAMSAGEFDQISGKGKPIEGLEEPYRPDWWLSRYLKREKLSLPCHALDVRAEIEQSLTKIMQLSSEGAVRREVDLVNAKIAKTNRTVTSGPSTTIGKLLVETIVQRWREHRARK